MLRDFETFLLKLGTIPDDKTKFYVHWVRRFLKSCNYQLENINTERVSQYLELLESDEKVADWQVKQAADAVTLDARSATGRNDYYLKVVSPFY